MGGPQSRSGRQLEEKFSDLLGNQTPIVQSETRPYTELPHVNYLNTSKVLKVRPAYSLSVRKGGMKILQFAHSISHSLSFLCNFDLTMCCGPCDEVAVNVSALGQVLIGRSRRFFETPTNSVPFYCTSLCKAEKKRLSLFLSPCLRCQEWDTKRKIL